MPKYTWSGKTKDGEAKTGVIEAPTLDVAESRLRSMDISPDKVKRKAVSSFQLKMPKLRQGVKLQSMMIFTRQLSTMIDAGLPLVQALDVLGTQEPNPYFKDVILGVKGYVEGGSTLADALKHYPKVFDSLFVNLIAAGEIGGILDTILNRLATYIEKNMAIRQSIKRAMFYPLLVLGITSVIVTGLITLVIPKFAGIFKSIGGRELPALTQFVIMLSKKGMVIIPIVIVVLIILYILWKNFRKNDKFRLATDRLLLKVPIMGRLIRMIAVARLSRTLSTLIASGVPILDAMDVVSKSAGNAVVERALLLAKLKVSEGKPLAESLGATNILPEMVIQMIAAGESTGAMDVMLEKVADFYEVEVDTAVEAMSSVIEPVLIVVLGGVVGFVIIAMYLPIFHMADNLSGHH